MNSKRVIVECDGHEVGWACQCGSFYSNMAFGGAEGAAKGAADACCSPKVCSRCGSIEDPFTLNCVQCANKDDEARWQKRFDAVKKVKERDYDSDMVYRDGLSSNGYVDTDAAPEELCDNGLEPWAYATKLETLTLDAREIVQDELESREFHEEAIDNIPEALFTDLQAHLDAWCAKANVTSNFPDYNTIVLFDEVKP
jgi:hypothetical protein